MADRGKEEEAEETAAGEGSVVETVAGQASEEEGVGEGGGVGDSITLRLRDSMKRG